MGVDLNLVKPNLHSFGDGICFAIYSYDVVSAGAFINEVVREDIGELKVRKTDLSAANGVRMEGEELYTTPLSQFLEVISEKQLGEYEGISKDSARRFGLSYIIGSSTAEDTGEVRDWIKLQACLTNPENFFDNYEKNIVYRLDRKKTLREMKKLKQELAPKIPDNLAEFTMVRGYAPYQEEITQPADLGVINFFQLKTKDRKKIEKTKSKLIEVLKAFEGPVLSLDALRINGQIFSLYENSFVLINCYGDVLSSNWKNRLFS